MQQLGLTKEPKNSSDIDRFSRHFASHPNKQGTPPLQGKTHEDFTCT